MQRTKGSVQSRWDSLPSVVQERIIQMKTDMERKEEAAQLETYINTRLSITSEKLTLPLLKEFPLIDYEERIVLDQKYKEKFPKAVRCTMDKVTHAASDRFAIFAGCTTKDIHTVFSRGKTKLMDEYEMTEMDAFIVIARYIKKHYQETVIKPGGMKSIYEEYKALFKKDFVLQFYNSHT